MKNLGLRLKKIRKQVGCSQDEFAQKLGITKQAISNIENSKSAPSVNVLSKLALDYNVNLNYLIIGKGSIYSLDDSSTTSIKKSILKEVEHMLKEKGIS
ncbi:MAG: helix-turn-helix transcriptional regulator [Candidatus Gastranaerophilales bacterium]|nr:helix-turn-helix transcriptional regulator [Candidatus Gastranaerophilales bacterium]